MKILLIDNQTKLLSELTALLDGEITIKTSDTVSFSDSENVDLVVLSGGHSFPVLHNEQRLREEILIVKNSNVPIIGICYGCELIAHVYGALLERTQDGEEKLIKVSTILADEIFEGRKDFEVFEAHRYVIENIPETIIALAKSEHGIEVIKHSNKPIYGLQFHPEHLMEGNDGTIIFKNIIKKLTQ